MAYKRIVYMCRICGKRETCFVSLGKPKPGKCPKKPRGGPHEWVVNKKLEN